MNRSKKQKAYILTLTYFLAVLTAVAWQRPASPLAQSAEMRPNILFALADDQSWPHAGAYGDQVVKTPTFDRVAAEGVLFSHAFCVSPSCTPSRGSILTGQTIHRLEEGGNLWSILPKKFQVYPDILEAAGYYVGYTRKGWGPGGLEGSGRARNPAGPEFESFEAFFKSIPPGKPFCFWFGSHDPHRPYQKGAGVKSGMKLEEVVVPPFLPDTPEVRSDILDYYSRIQRFDRDAGEILKLLQSAGRLDNTVFVMTSDNGMPFPRAKANLYDSGTRMPLAVRWPARVKSQRRVVDFISFTDFAPTLLEAAGLKPLPEMTGRSFLGLLTGAEKPGSRNTVFLERERHANVRRGDLSYPVRAVRTREFLYIQNLKPDRWPGGDPEMYHSVGPFGDCDNSPTKDVILERREDPSISKFFKLAFAKRPAEELYDLARDPHQLTNVADRSGFAAAKNKLHGIVQRWMIETGDPLAGRRDDPWDHYLYFGPPGKMPGSAK